MHQFFISIRVGDHDLAATDLDNALVKHFGKDAVFYFHRDSSAGKEYEPRILAEVIPQCKALLAVIGPQWLTEHNKGRLHDPDDLVRREIEAAVQNGVTVIPVYVGGLNKPAAEKLPKSLQFLAGKIGHFVLRDGKDFAADVERVIAELDHDYQPALPSEEYLEHFQTAVQQAWDEQWDAAPPDASTSDPTDDDTKPPFIASQGVRLLATTDRPERWLKPEHFRSRRAGAAVPSVLPSHDGDAEEEDPWVPIDPAHLVAGETMLPDGSRWRLPRTVVTTDAGIGKTVRLKWLHKEVNQPGSETLAFYIDLGELAEIGVDTQKLTDVINVRLLAPQFKEFTERNRDRVRFDEVLVLLDHLRRQGRIALLFDGLDQLGGTGAPLTLLKALLKSGDWGSCRIVLAGRPHALVRHWGDLFADGSTGWRFVQVDEFDDEQQREYLGGERYYTIDPGAREILTVPRVLSYLRTLPAEELPKIRTPADVYWRAADHMIEQGLANSHEARRLGVPSGQPVPEQPQEYNIRRAWQLLSAIAFEMVATLVPRDENDAASEKVPNFNRVRPKQEFEQFLARVIQRLGATSLDDKERYEFNINYLGALNDVLHQGFLDVDSRGAGGLKQILWRNRSLQEFFAAYYLATRCSEEDQRLLWDWVYLPERLLSEEYYWVWRFLTEMPEDACDKPAWVRAVAPLYQPGDGTAEGTKRSGEMIYRSWDRMQEYARGRIGKADEFLSAFRGEFQQILDGQFNRQRGAHVQRIARSLVESFVDIPAGEFRMGSPPEEQGMPDDQREAWQDWIERSQDDPEAAAECLVANWYGPDRQGQRYREYDQRFYARIARERDLAAVERRLYTWAVRPDAPPAGRGGR